MMHAPDLNSQMQGGTIHQGNSLSVSTWHFDLGKLGIKCQGHPVVHRQLPPHPPPTVISLTLKGVSNQVTCPQVQVFLLMRNYKHGFRCELLHEFCKKWATKAPKHIDGEPNNQGKLHLLVGSELKHEKGSKNSTMEAWGLLFS